MAVRTTPPAVTLDAAGKTLGRFASLVASTLRGKHLPSFTPNLVPGVHVNVINLKRIALTPKKMAKPVRHFSGYPGGLKTESFGDSFTKNPEAAFRRVVRRMLPTNKLRARYLRFLHIQD